MVDKSYCKTNIDINFIKAIKLLDEHKISYWVCHGSLLGLIRDGNLIPWDHDIDLAVWETDHKKKEILDIFILAGFKLKDNNVMGSLHFVREGGRGVDINFYQELQSFDNHLGPLVGVIWRMPRSRVGAMFNIIFQNQEYRGEYKSLYKVVTLFQILFIPIYKILDRLNLLFVMKGYTTPKLLLSKFIFVDYFGVSCRIPENSEEILSFLYGSDWRTPVREYDWTTQSSSVVTID